MTSKILTVLALSLLPLFAWACPVNINTAPKAQLMTLHNIGEAKADAIIREREKAPFKSPADITKVKGVGEATFEKNKDCIVVGSKK